MKKQLLMDSRWLVLALSGFCLIVFWSFLINQVATVRFSYLDIARRDTANIVLALAEHTVRTLESLQHLLRLVQQRTVDQQQDIAFAELVTAQGDLPMLSSHLALYDSQGNLIEGSQHLPLPGGSVAGQDFFRAVANSDGRTIVISKPVQHPETQRWAIPIGIRLSGPDGGFQGAAYLFIQPYYFMEFYNAVDVGPNGSMVLVTRQGTILARRAKNDQAIGKSFPAARLFSEVERAPRGTYKTASITDGVMRIHSYQAIAKFPVIVVVALAEADVLAPFFQQRRYLLIQGCGFSLIILLLTAGIVQQINQQRRLIHHDTLTGLPNRRLLGDRVAQAIAVTRRNRDRLALLFLDLDGFKQVNDTLGHAVGDQLLIIVSERLQGCVRRGDTVARLGGDEFVIVALGLHKPEEATIVAEKILEVLRQPIVLVEQSLPVMASIGISVFPEDGQELDTLLKYADTAMYRAKAAGRNTYRFFTAALQTRAATTLAMENRLQQALEQGELQLYYQPQVALASGQPVALETLLCWQHPDQGLLFPTRFTGMIAERGLQLAINDWVLRTACRQNRLWQTAGLAALPVAVSLSLTYFRQPNLMQRVADCLRETGLAASYLELGLDQSSLLQQQAIATGILSGLAGMRVGLAIDNFGVDHYRLSHLRQWPVNRLKLGGTLIDYLGAEPAKVTVVANLIRLAHDLNLQVLAKEVNNEPQRALLATLGCDQVQGDYDGQPLSAEQMTAWLRKRAG